MNRTLLKSIKGFCFAVIEFFEEDQWPSRHHEIDWEELKKNLREAREQADVVSAIDRIRINAEQVVVPLRERDRAAKLRFVVLQMFHLTKYHWSDQERVKKDLESIDV